MASIEWTVFFLSTPALALLAVVLAAMNLRRGRPARGIRAAVVILAICVVAVVLYASGGDDDTSNHASRWAVHPSAHTPICVALLAEVAAVVVLLAARGRAALVWGGVLLTTVATGATLWSLSQTLH